MHNEKLRVSLFAKPDRNGKKMYVGKIKFPGMIDCTNGIVFLVFTSEDGSEEIQIAQQFDDNQNRRAQTTQPRDPGPSGGTNGQRY